MTPQSPAPVAGRPLTAVDVALLKKGDVLWDAVHGATVEVTEAVGASVSYSHPDFVPNGCVIAGVGLEWLSFIGRPDADGWMPWAGGENPVPGQMVEVKIRWRNGEPSEGEVLSDRMAWAHRRKGHGEGGDIIAFRLSRPASEQPVEAIGAGREEGGSFLLMKRGLYYRPNAQGYTGIKDYAGRYTAEEAADRSDPVAGVTAIAETEAPEFSPKCYDDQARAHLSKKLAEAEAKIAALAPASPARTPMGGEVEALREVKRFLDGEHPSAPRGVRRYSATWHAELQSIVDEALATSSPSPAQGGIATWHPLDDNGMAEVRINGKRITTMPSYPGAEEVAQRINAALSASPQPEAGEAVAWREPSEPAPRDGRWIVTINKYRGVEAIRWSSETSRLDPEARERGWVSKSGSSALSPERAVAWCLAPPSVQPVKGK